MDVGDYQTGFDKFEDKDNIQVDLMIAPQMRKAKKERKFLTDLKTGDRVVMKSGMHGRVNHINQKEGTCIIETTAGKLKFNIARVVLLWRPSVFYRFGANGKEAMVYWN